MQRAVIRLEDEQARALRAPTYASGASDVSEEHDRYLAEGRWGEMRRA